ncbi:NrdH-redoxin [Paludifilum halophilum]|uniref:NrdH-redoxin n=1 Tax=Paludifilum halophilum TaxID=1642702 RepID=A0A235B5R4_9BACL|nr:NrdH-redoxin [Paludifilum halophilum]
MDVVVYSKLHCLECNLVKRFLKDHEIPFEVRDCSTHPEYLEQVQEMGFLGVPVTVVGGQPIQGLQPAKILQLLGKEEG